MTRKTDNRHFVGPRKPRGGYYRGGKGAENALLQIAELYHRREWNADTCSDTAEVLRAAGFTIREPALNDESKEP